jgi:hypothetical protein
MPSPRYLSESRPCASGEYGNQAKPLFGAARVDPLLGASLQHAVVVLQRDGPVQAQRLGKPGVFGDHLGIVVAPAEVADFARFHQLIERPQRLLGRRLAVRMVYLIQVDVICLQSAQAVVAGIDDMLASRPLAVRAGPHAPPALGRDGQRPPVLVLHPASHDLFRPTGGIDIGGIEKVDPLFDSGIQNGERLLVGDTSAEVDPCPQADLGNRQAGAAQSSIVHNSAVSFLFLSYSGYLVTLYYDGTGAQASFCVSFSR